LIELREQMRRRRLVLGAVPSRALARFDLLDVSEREVIAQRDEHMERLATLEPSTHRLGRVHAPDAAERSFLVTALEMDERALSEVRAERTRLQRELGNPDQIRSEREAIETAIEQLQQEYSRVRDALADRLLEARPPWLTEALGDRPEHDRQSATWDRAARSVATYRLDHDISDPGRALGPVPSRGDAGRREWDQANAQLVCAQRQLGQQRPAREHGLDLGLDDTVTAGPSAASATVRQWPTYRSYAPTPRHFVNLRNNSPVCSRAAIPETYLASPIGALLSAHGDPAAFGPELARRISSSMPQL
jgi:hypothetical protein